MTPDVRKEIEEAVADICKRARWSTAGHHAEETFHALLAQRIAGMREQLPHSLFAEAMAAGECCATCAIDVFRKRRLELQQAADRLEREGTK